MVSPPRPGRTRRLVLAVAAAGAVAAVGLWLYPDLARRGDFTSDPRPCSLVTAGTARLVAGRAEGVEAGSACTWADPGGDPQPVLEVRVTRLATARARADFRRVKEESEGKTGPMTAELSDFGDEAFSRIRNPSRGRVTSEVWFRQGNVVVAVRYAPADGGLDPSQAGAYEVATEAAARLGKGN
ncbi:hypothetical protein [Streptomyces sp. W1SF4]|uniref:hypothetical protein n=1 Tax=Streptomyces sp. W1SF4 TaxID=2305220 RepID=UPI000F6BA94A|nr:hypothetical protein [Streptomyces sp. W1SF4]AZM92673.1 hypothetical protein D1J60_33005 [Streptomyces sp. W1SF4]